MANVRRTREEKLRDKEAQLERIADNNIAWNYVNNRLSKQNERLRCKLEYLEKMEKEIVESSDNNKGFGLVKI